MDVMIDRAATVLRRGGVVAYPTDTLYALGVDPRNAAAVGAFMVCGALIVLTGLWPALGRAMTGAVLLARLLELLLAVERDLGRERRERWGPRSIDLDLLVDNTKNTNNTAEQHIEGHEHTLHRMK